MSVADSSGLYAIRLLYLISSGKRDAPMIGSTSVVEGLSKFVQELVSESPELWDFVWNNQDLPLKLDNGIELEIREIPEFMAEGSLYQLYVRIDRTTTERHIKDACPTILEWRDRISKHQPSIYERILDRLKQLQQGPLSYPIIAEILNDQIDMHLTYYCDYLDSAEPDASPNLFLNIAHEIMALMGIEEEKREEYVQLALVRHQEGYPMFVRDEPISANSVKDRLTTPRKFTPQSSPLGWFWSKRLFEVIESELSRMSESDSGADTHATRA